MGGKIEPGDREELGVDEGTVGRDRQLLATALGERPPQPRRPGGQLKGPEPKKVGSEDAPARSQRASYGRRIPWTDCKTIKSPEELLVVTRPSQHVEDLMPARLESLRQLAVEPSTALTG